MFVVPAQMLSPGWIRWLPLFIFLPFRYMSLSSRISIVLCEFVFAASVVWAVEGWVAGVWGVVGWMFGDCTSTVWGYMARLAAVSFSEIWSQGRLPIRIGLIPIVDRCCSGASISMDIMFSGWGCMAVSLGDSRY